MMPSQASCRSAALALQAANFQPNHVGALVHGSVCRDFLEPATACRVHHHLGLPWECTILDVSNACLGMLSGAQIVANMIELGQIRAGLVVGTEGSRQLVETTIETLNSDVSLTRNDVKLAMASLTIGSASCAWLLVDRELSQHGTPLLGGCTRANTDFHGLCHSGRDEAGQEMRPLMRTDSEQLLQAGIETGAETFECFLAELDWSRDTITRTICHQVGPTHRRLLMERLGLPQTVDFSTVQWLGNTGSVALPITLAIGQQCGHIRPSDRLALLGIGSGINCVMFGSIWGTCPVLGWDDAEAGFAGTQTLPPRMSSLAAK
jgi:3-oxoacyl-[acyl-carrier-protein] synthase-3